jgi:sodium--glutamate symport carrier gltS
MIDLKLDVLQTLTLAALVYFGGIQLRKRIAFVDRLNIPAAVVGGLLLTTLVLPLHARTAWVSLREKLPRAASLEVLDTMLRCSG